MSRILNEKLQKLEKSDQYECWYLVKQPTDFSAICYLVSFLEKFKKENAINKLDMNLSDYIDNRVEKLVAEKNISISKNYRALRVAAFFGLITMYDNKYENAKITDAFKEINTLTQGEFEKKELYRNVITRQIEKMFVSSGIDEECNGVRVNYRLFPVILLYKILLELGKSNKSNYSITMTEYRYLVATTEKYEDYMDTLLQIIELRNNQSYNQKFEKYRTKFDNRMIQALKQLDTLSIDSEQISIPANKIKEVTKKVNVFENNILNFSDINYLQFLASTNDILYLFVKEKYHEVVKENEGNYYVAKRIKGGKNILLYGVPGSGKSYTISKEYCDDESKIERIVFHPDYMNTDFIGQILPTIKEDKTITYEFTPGPFTRIMKKAYEDPENKYYLIIEEINRGNAPAIFGDVFQLLDRNEDGTSSYSIKNYNVANVIYGNDDVHITIPSNLSILATMNTADQNVFTLDTAFQRRWIMRLVKNDVSKAKHAKIEILDTEITWEVFNTTINDFILANNSSTMSSEDKRLGAYFITEDVLKSKDDSLFSEKVIKYLWDDAFKFARNKLFDSGYHSLEKVIEDFCNFSEFNRFNIFTSEVKNQLSYNSGIKESAVVEETSEESSESHIETFDKSGEQE